MSRGGPKFENLWSLQFTRGEGTGAWAWLYFGLAPWESEGAGYFGAALAAVAVGLAPDDYAASPELEGRLTMLRRYLLEGFEARSPMDRVMLLWASAELSDLVTPEQRQSIIEGLFRLQNGDGGWSLRSLGDWAPAEGLAPGSTSDGYATALIAFVLQRAAVVPSQENLSQALGWLTRSQDPTGGHWPSSSLNRQRDPASDRGRFMSDAATAFAVLALTEATQPRE